MIETWLLKAVDGRDVLMDSGGNCTLQGDGSNKRFEFRKDEHSGDNREALAKKVSYFLGVDCVWLSRFCNLRGLTSPMNTADASRLVR